MDFFIAILFISIILLIAFFKPKIKGLIGEKSISFILSFLNKDKYIVINDIVLQNGDKTTQIDHIVISAYGIFVIETKNYKGWIFGSENSEYWTQVLFKRKEKLYNPIKQNRSHIIALKKLLSQYPGLKYIPIIVFSAKAKIKVEATTDVIKSYQIISTIKKYSGINLTDTDKEGIFHIIHKANLASTYDKREHVKSIKRRIQKREDNIRNHICPQCGGNLTLKDGKFGKFLGCSSYPRCKFSRRV